MTDLKKEKRGQGEQTSSVGRNELDNTFAAAVLHCV